MGLRIMANGTLYAGSASARNGIQAIETTYKGYRFRSRLEARWAIFFDLVGVHWTYEVEPLNVNGKAYLPDFRVCLRGQDVVHEVKPESASKTITAPRVYLAGKMKPCWRGEASGSLRRGVSTEKLCRSPVLSWLDAGFDTQMCGVPFIMGGPFECRGNHGGDVDPDGIHGAEDACQETLDPAYIHRAALAAIQACDLVCAHIEAADAFGTFAEIGFARGIGKRVSISFAQSLTDGMERGTDWLNHGAPLTHDLWFVEAMQTVGSAHVADAEDARSFHASVIDGLVSREYKLIAGIGIAGFPACLTFGDPLHVCEYQSGLCWGIGRQLIKLCETHTAEAQQARSHRFDNR